MKTTKLINTLQELVEKYGDLPIDIYSDQAGQGEIIGGFAVATEDGPDSEVVGFSICGKETAEAFFANAEEANNA